MKDRLEALRAISNIPNNNVEIDLNENNFMPDFYNLCEDVKSTTQKIVNTVNEIKKLHVTILAAPTTDNITRIELDKRMNEINDAKRDIQKKLKSIEEDIHKSPVVVENSEIRIKKSQSKFLSHLYTNALIEFNTAQVEHQQNCKKRIVRQLEITGKQTTESEIDQMIESGNTQIFTEGLLKETQIAKATLDEIQERHKDILKLENSIKELASMFNEIATLIYTQGELIDNIEKNMSQTTNYVETAKKETEKAVVYQSKARRKKIILIIILIAVVGTILAIIIGVLVSKFKN